MPSCRVKNPRRRDGVIVFDAFRVAFRVAFGSFARADDEGCLTKTGLRVRAPGADTEAQVLGRGTQRQWLVPLRIKRGAGKLEVLYQW